MAESAAAMRTAESAAAMRMAEPAAAMRTTEPAAVDIQQKEITAALLGNLSGLRRRRLASTNNDGTGGKRKTKFKKNKKMYNKTSKKYKNKKARY